MSHFYYTNLQITDWYEYQSICDDTLNIQKKYLGNNGYVNDEKLETLLHEILVYAESKKTSGEMMLKLLLLSQVHHLMVYGLVVLRHG